jgi:hypothetical protein
MDAFAFEFMGLVMIALCLAVLAVPRDAALQARRATTDPSRMCHSRIAAAVAAVMQRSGLQKPAEPLQS